MLLPPTALAGVNGSTFAGPASASGTAAAIPNPLAGVLMASSNWDWDYDPNAYDDDYGGRDRLNEFSAQRLGIQRNPRHHVFPQEERTFFQERGFHDIDDFTLELDQATHEAIHGGAAEPGSATFQLGRAWEGNWNRQIMIRINNAEAAIGRPLTRAEIIGLGEDMVRGYELVPPGAKVPFVPYR